MQPEDISDRLLKEARIKTYQNLKGIRDNEVRRKATLLFKVLEAKNILEGCRRAGLDRNTFYDWMKRLYQEEYSLFVLKNKSRRPHHSNNSYINYTKSN